MKISETEQFRRSYQSLDEFLRRKVKKKIVLFIQNLFHPFLRIEKLEPKDRNIWSFRADKNIRVIFTFLDKGGVLFLDIGPHDIYRKVR